MQSWCASHAWPLVLVCLCAPPPPPRSRQRPIVSSYSYDDLEKIKKDMRKAMEGKGGEGPDNPGSGGPGHTSPGEGAARVRFTRGSSMPRVPPPGPTAGALQRVLCSSTLLHDAWLGRVDMVGGGGEGEG
jgi:hypothetical protein